MNTKKDYEEYLNDLGIPNDDLHSNGGRIPDKTKNYGSWLRKNDSIAFNIGYNEYLYTCNSYTSDIKKFMGTKYIMKEGIKNEFT